MAKVIKERSRELIESYSLHFGWKDHPGSGFGFDCDKQGVVDESKLEGLGLENYRKCLSGEYDVLPGELMDFSHYYTNPTVIECHCGKHVSLDTNDNMCECGQWYNMSGQELVDPSLWGEETGETYSDIMGPHRDDDWF